MAGMRVKPSKPVSAGSIAQLIVMLLFGLGFAVFVGSFLLGVDLPFLLKGVFFLFMAGWIGTVIVMLVYHARNLKGAKGTSLFEIETDPGDGDRGEPADFETRLRKIERLQKDGLITREEYERKRTAIMGERW